MDKNIVKKAEMIYEKETKFLNRHFLAKEILEILDESKLAVFKLRGF